MQKFIFEIINQFGYIGVFLLIMIENVFPPIPSEAILTFGGFITTFAQINVWGVIVAATAGSVIGAVILYAIGSAFSEDSLEGLFNSKLGKLLRIKKDDIKKAEEWFLKRGKKAVFFCRFVPIVRSLISIPAGTTKMELSSFLILTVIGTFIWNMVLVFLGRLAGDAWGKIVDYFDIYKAIVIVIIGAIGVVVVARFIKKRFR